MPATKSMVVAALVLSSFAALFSGAALLIASGVVRVGGTPSGEVAVSGDFAAQADAFIRANPEVLLESVRQLEVRQQAAAMDEMKVVVRERREDILNDPADPVLGNPEGDVTLVEFFDYNCPYCRQAAPMMAEIQAGDKELRLVYKEFPILGPGSFFAAQAALASQKQGKYVEFHEALMNHSGQVDERSTLELASEVGLDVEQLKKDMQDPAIDEAIQRTLALATDLRINGTPSFIVGEEIVRGLTDRTTLEGLIAEARAPADG